MDLSKRPEKKIKEELNKIASLPFMITIYEPPKEIERAVLNTVNEPVFNTATRLSFKPQEYNNEFQRASTPNNTMFYGSVIPENLSNEEIDNARIISIAESCELVRNETREDGEQLISFGKWLVKEPLNLITIVDPSKHYNIQYLKNLVNDYNDCLKINCPDNYGIIQEVLAYLSDEFSKKVDPNEKYNYMISAILTEILVYNVKNKVDGILYPSVQVGELGLCVAIKPESMHKLELISVCQSNAVRKDNVVEVVNVKYCIVDPPNSDFVLESIN